MKFINQQLIKDTNMKHLYTSIYHNPGISRAHLSKQTALSKTTVSTLIDELIERNFILDGGAGESGTTGRKPNQLYIRRNSHFVVVFNWYENRIYTHLVDIAGTSVFQEACELKQGEAYVSASRNCFQNSVLQHCAPDEILGICVVIAAMIDEKHGEIYSTTISLPSMEGSQILDSLKEAFPDYPVDLLNDTACYSYAEKIYGGITEKNSPLSILETGASVLPFSWTAPCWERPAALLPSSATILWTPKGLYASAETMAAWRLSSRSPGLRSEARNLARSLP